MEIYDVIVIGAGPAGGKCAFELAKKGIRVLLVEKFARFEENDFSSAGMLFETVKDFSIPDEVIASNWNKLTIQTSQSTYSWGSDSQHGVVLSFAKLKKWLAEQCEKQGGSVWMGHRYESKEVFEDKVKVTLTNIATNSKVICEAKLLIDATGPARKVMYDKKETQPKMLIGTAVEYLVEVPQEVYNRYKNDLVFFLGDKWTDMGYSWIFPMDNNTLKVGSGRVVPEFKTVRKDLKLITEQILESYMNLAPTDFRVLDVHGGSLRFSKGQKDIFYRNKVVGIGDTVSTVNPLGGEGIAYAMESAEMAVPYIEKYIKKNQNQFYRYKLNWRRKYYFKWLICEMACERVYTTYTDEKVENRISMFSRTFTIEEMKQLLFHFNLKGFRTKVAAHLFKRLLKLK